MTEKRLDRRTFAGLAGAAVLSALPLPGRAGTPGILGGAAPVATISGAAFGTTWKLVLPAGADLAPLRPAISEVLAEIDRQMSPWRADSDISRFNRASAGPHALAEETVTVARAALKIARATGGAFDPTVGPLVARWGFGPIAGDPRPGWQDVALAGNGISKRRDGVTLDLCGIAKGRALDRVGRLLRDVGETDFLLDIGGELLASGLHPAGRPWRAGIEDPRPGAIALHGVLELHGAAVATSGTRRNGFGFRGRTYSHIIDPATRHPVGGALVSVSVIASSAMLADGWATALMAAGETEGPAVASRHGVAALFLEQDGAALRRRATGGFDAHLLA